jgi:uncharacterized membrane protein YraQ (UPF0718 family)
MSDGARGIFRRWTPSRLLFPAAFAVFVGVSLAADLQIGVRAGENLLRFAREMALIVPSAFVLIGLFEAWVPQHAIERHVGPDTGFRGHLWATLLAGSTVGGLMVAFPVAFALRGKGARFGVVFSYLGSAGVVRVPMTFFEISFLGVPFTLLRYAVALPLVVLTAELLGRVLERRGYEMRAVHR